jgi:hypothetical protein
MGGVNLDMLIFVVLVAMFGFLRCEIIRMGYG